MIEMLIKVYYFWIDNLGVWVLYIYLLYFGNFILENLFEIIIRGKCMLLNFYEFLFKI